jgi:hypothetical protein
LRSNEKSSSDDNMSDVEGEFDAETEVGEMSDDENDFY